MHILVSSFELSLLLCQLVQILLVLALSLGPLLLSETAVTASTEHVVIVLFEWVPVVLMAALDPIRIIQVNIINDAITILVEVFEDIIKIKVAVGAIAIHSIVDLRTIYSVFISISVHVVTVLR